MLTSQEINDYRSKWIKTFTEEGFTADEIEEIFTTAPYNCEPIVNNGITISKYFAYICINHTK